MIKYILIINALLIPTKGFAEKKKDRNPAELVECSGDAYEKAMKYLVEKTWIVQRCLMLVRKLGIPTKLVSPAETTAVF